MRKIYLLPFIVLSLAACAHKAAEKPVEATPAAAPAPTVNKAQAVLKGSGKSKIKGVVHFTEENGKTTIEVIAEGIKAGPHGFHIHEGKECVADFTSAGGHFNPTTKTHGAMDAAHHAGDLGNVTADKNKKVQTTITSESLTFAGADSILGRTVIIHADRDDLKSQPAGNSGKRIACGVIEAI